MNLKTTTQLAIEIGCFDENNNLFLCGIDGLSQVNQQLYFAIKNNNITQDNTFKNTFGFDCKFFYAIEHMENSEVIRYERGVGYLSQVDDKVFLNREPIISGKNSQDLFNYNKLSQTKFQCSDCRQLVVYSTYPTSYFECLLDSNSIITSIAPLIPHSFVVEENSLVGRLDGNVESISFKNKTFIDLISEALCKYTKQLSLKTSKLDAKKISAPILQINPSAPPPAKEGCIYYDESEKALKFYDGTKWRTLIFKDDK